MAFGEDTKIIAYYFHGNARCVTCYKMEQYAKEAIEENFKDELVKGLLVFKEVNIEEKENKHFVDEYQLYTKTLVISYIEDGKEIKHKKLTKIWEYVRDKKKFFNYVTTEISTYLKDI
ncbi:MAG: nitrophenyl compound nitroreductase subunit ArsF family protein [Candidatus Omnitrophica bacterium]|nr:nitrophenyl compound nitroreductase subunit ArsF family protein [Candidatus Omnitrophota bacterium]